MILGLCLIFGIVFLMRIALWKRLPKGCQEVLIMLEQKILFNSFLRALIESYLSTCIACMLSNSLIWGKTPETAGQKINMLSSIATVPYIIAFPFGILQLLQRNQQYLGD